MTHITPHNPLKPPETTKPPSALIREELKTGYPLNIPDNLLINDATIQYKEDYILITADDVVVNL